MPVQWVQTFVIAVVGFFLIRYFLRFDKMLDLMTDIQKVLAVHANELKHHDDDIDDLFKGVYGKHHHRKRGDG